jgi:hypothetical protein
VNPDGQVKRTHRTPASMRVFASRDIFIMYCTYIAAEAKTRNVYSTYAVHPGRHGIYFVLILQCVVHFVVELKNK